MNYKIYTTYHDDSLIEQYDLNNDEHHIMFPTHKSISGNNINNVSKYFNEFSTMYYVWKNNKYCDFIGFEHYRRKFDINRIPNLNNDEVYVRIYEQHNNNVLNDDKKWLLDLTYYEKNIKKLYGENNKYIDYMYNCHNIVWDMCYIMLYDKFCEMMKFIWELCEMFDNDINANYNYDNYLKFYNNNTYFCRGHILERLVSMWIICNYDNLKIYAENLI